MKEVNGGLKPKVELGDVHLSVLGAGIGLLQPDVQLLDLVLSIKSLERILLTRNVKYQLLTLPLL